MKIEKGHTIQCKKYITVELNKLGMTKDTHNLKIFEDYIDNDWDYATDTEYGKLKLTNKETGEVEIYDYYYRHGYNGFREIKKVL